MSCVGHISGGRADYVTTVVTEGEGRCMPLASCSYPILCSYPISLPWYLGFYSYIATILNLCLPLVVVNTDVGPWCHGRLGKYRTRSNYTLLLYTRLHYTTVTPGYSVFGSCIGESELVR